MSYIPIFIMVAIIGAIIFGVILIVAVLDAIYRQITWQKPEKKAVVEGVCSGKDKKDRI